MRGKIFIRLALIAVMCASCGVMMLPTFGQKSLVVTFKNDVTPDQINSLKGKFSSGFKFSQKGNVLTVKSYKLTDAEMNDIKTFSYVKDAFFEKHWAEKYLLAKKISLGLDLQGGMSLVLSADYSRMEQRTGKKFTDSEKKDITEQALERISNRINTFGVSEPSIRMKGVDAIEIQLPGVKDPQGVKTAIGTIGRVEYRLTNDEYSAVVKRYMEEKAVVIPELADEQKEFLARLAVETKLPADSEYLIFFDRNEKNKNIHPVGVTAVSRQVALAGDDIAKAFKDSDNMGRLAVGFHLTDQGAKKFAEVTSKKNWGRSMAIIIDDKIRSAPGIGVQILDGRAVIQGNFTEDEVKVLSRIINEGALPVDLKIEEERTVGATLGQDAIDAGINSIIACAIIIGFFMLVYYKASGLIANFCLLVTTIIMMSLLSMMGFTLTLPGIAGLVLTIGIAVDANVLIYERIKEELRMGKSVTIAVESGYEKAFWTIFDSNLTTLLAAFILAQMETGPIKGFAVTLAVGIIASMIGSLFVSKIIFQIVLLVKKDIKKLSI